ncbi:Peroxygenase 1 [Cladophialophora chaetospira]|uniref:Peroxygenase 1 n=1 Tax=Cladophialophora chaetospira TaxID=386627 RepID=A0AA39CPT4_9EURO|nr:Peroxygenase 1 [Cladophialophora chaetospira]
MSSNPTVRIATSEDVPIILAFMRATAVEQGVPEAVTATEADLLNTLDLSDKATDISAIHQNLSRNGKALVLAAPEGEIAGMAIYFVTYVAWSAKSGLCLEDLYVLPAYRCRGYARLLVEAIVKDARRLGCVRTEWLCYKENHQALRFYRNIGAKELDNLTLLRLDRDAMVELTDEDRVVK